MFNWRGSNVAEGLAALRMVDDMKELCSDDGETLTFKAPRKQVMQNKQYGTLTVEIHALEVCGAWTKWVTIRFEGYTMRECLALARKRKEANG